MESSGQDDNTTNGAADDAADDAKEPAVTAAATAATTEAVDSVITAVSSATVPDSTTTRAAQPAAVDTTPSRSIYSLKMPISSSGTRVSVFL